MISTNVVKMLMTFSFGSDYIEEYAVSDDYNKILNRIKYLKENNELLNIKVKPKTEEIILTETTTLYKFGYRQFSGTYKIEAVFLFRIKPVLRIHYYVETGTKILLLFSGVFILIYLILILLATNNMLNEFLNNFLQINWIILIGLILIKVISYSFIISEINRFRNKIYILQEK